MSEDKSPFIWGAENIGKEIGKGRREVYHLARTGALPVKKVGNQLVGNRDELRDLSKWPGAEAKRC